MAIDPKKPADQVAMHADPLYLSALASLGEGAALGPTANSADNRPSIAVLPFTNISGDKEQEYFADGITEDIITELARNRGLFVIARNSSFTFKGAAVDVGEVGQRLGVRYLVEGSVRKVLNRVRITAQLIEVATGTHVWAERYDRELEDIFAVQDEVTRSVVASVPGHLQSDIVKASRRKPTESLDAYDRYLRGMEIVNRWSDDVQEVKDEFEAAVRIDPNFARAHALLGQTYLRVWWQTDELHLFQLADKETDLAVRLDNEDSTCLSLRGVFLVNKGDYAGAFDVLQRALRLTPDDVHVNERMAYYFVCSGQSDRAIECCLKAIRTNPIFLPSTFYDTLGTALMLTRRYEEAIKAFAAIVRPGFYIHVRAAACLAKLGRLDAAREQCRLASGLRADWADVNWGHDYQSAEDTAHERELVRLAIDAIRRGSGEASEAPVT